MKQYKYLHTLDGKPAYYNGDQIVYGAQYTPLVNDLRTIKKQQQFSKEWRIKKGFGKVFPVYGYCKILL